MLCTVFGTVLRAVLGTVSRAIFWAISSAVFISILGTAPCAAQTGLRFTVPSGATSEASRLYLDLIQEFNQANPDIRVEFHPFSDWDEVVGDVKNRVAHGQSAGVFVAEVSETLELEHFGLITAFAEALEREDGGVDAFTAPLVKEFLGNSFCADGRFCGPPFVRSTPVAFYNLDRLREVGVDSEHLPTTWGETEVLLRKLKARSNQPPFGLGGDWYDYLFEAAVLQAGGALSDQASHRVTLDTPESVAALRYWKRLMDEGLMTRATSWKATLNGFVNGIYPVVYYSSGGMATVREADKSAWMAAGLPRDKQFGVAVGGGNLYLSANMSGPEKAAALKLTRFLYSPAVQARISLATGFFPVVEAAFDDPALASRYCREEPFMRVRGQLRFAKSKVMSFDNLRVRDILKHAIDRSLDEGVDPAMALGDAQREVDRVLGQ